MIYDFISIRYFSTKPIISKKFNVPNQFSESPGKMSLSSDDHKIVYLQSLSFMKIGLKSVAWSPKVNSL